MTPEQILEKIYIYGNKLNLFGLAEVLSSLETRISALEPKVAVQPDWCKKCPIEPGEIMYFDGKCPIHSKEPTPEWQERFQDEFNWEEIFGKNSSSQKAIMAFIKAEKKTSYEDGRKELLDTLLRFDNWTPWERGTIKTLSEQR